MAKIVDPLQFTTAYKIDPKLLADLGVLDPTLNVDTKLFVDPLLLATSNHQEIRAARRTYKEHFSKVIKFLDSSRLRGDLAWRTAESLLTFPEISLTCIGYGAASISGSGFGPILREELMTTAKEIIALGIKDPDLFTAMALFESNIGPDRISDLTTRIILADLVKFNDRILHELKIPTMEYELVGSTVRLAANPKVHNQPIILLPLDVLRQLPIVLDWGDVIDAAHHNAVLRKRVNSDIAEIWSLKAKSRKEKLKIRAAAMQSKRSFETFLAMFQAPKKNPYDAGRDPQGELFWRQILSTLSAEYPLKLELTGTPDKTKAIAVVEAIIKQYRHLIEDRRFSSELYKKDRSPRPEKAAQRFFFAVADCYCKANNLDVTPEADTGAGSVDFKFSVGYDCRIVVEMKLSTNPKIVSGFENQITAYAEAEDAIASYYVVIDVGHMGRKDEALNEIRNNWKRSDKRRPELCFVDGRLRKPASER